MEQYLLVGSTDVYESVTLSQPGKHNAINSQMAIGLLELFQAPLAESSKPILLDGDGASFCSGIDLDEPGQAALSALFGRVLAAMDGCDRPIVCLCRGAVLGAGLQLALGADVILATPDTAFGMPHAKLGRVPRSQLVRRLTERVPVGLARYMLLTGESIEVARFVAAGVVLEVAAESTLRPRVDEVCRALQVSGGDSASSLKSQLAANALDG